MYVVIYKRVYVLGKRSVKKVARTLSLEKKDRPGFELQVCHILTGHP